MSKKNQITLAKESKCVFCGSSNTEYYDNLDADKGKCTQTASCWSCEAQWIEVYKLDEIEVKALPATESETPKQVAKIMARHNE